MEEIAGRIADEIYSEGICVCRDFLSEKEVDVLLGVFKDKHGLLREAGIGRNETHIKARDIRGDKILWVEKGENNILDECFFLKMGHLMTALNRRCFLGLNDYEFHFACYEAGTFYKRHRDVFSNNDARKISVILYLNKNWKKEDGGELKIYSDDILTVEPLAGTLVAFESHIEHEVITSYADRISITGWMKRSDKLI